MSVGETRERDYTYHSQNVFTRALSNPFLLLARVSYGQVGRSLSRLPLYTCLSPLSLQERPPRVQNSRLTLLQWLREGDPSDLRTLRYENIDERETSSKCLFTGYREFERGSSYRLSRVSLDSRSSGRIVAPSGRQWTSPVFLLSSPG